MLSLVNPSGGRAGKREDGLLDTIRQLTVRRDRALGLVSRFCVAFPHLEPLARDFELALTTDLDDVEVRP